MAPTDQAEYTGKRSVNRAVNMLLVMKQVRQRRDESLASHSLQPEEPHLRS